MIFQKGVFRVKADCGIEGSRLVIISVGDPFDWGVKACWGFCFGSCSLV